MIAYFGLARTCLTIILAFVFTCPNAFAAGRVALVIGNNVYHNIATLNNAINDARLVAQLLESANFDVVLVENASRSTFWKAIDDFRLRVNKGDEAIFFFAGHGVQIGSEPILLPTDIVAGHEREVARNGVAIHEILDALRYARVSVVIVDACRDNPFPRDKFRSIGSVRGLEPVIAPEGNAIMLSAGRGQTALDIVPSVRVPHGLFTYGLVERLRKPGISVRAALMDTREYVEVAAARVGHVQRPTLVDEMRGDFFLFPKIQSEASKASAKQIDVDTLAWQAASEANVLAGFEAYLREFPQGRYASVARVRIAGWAQRQSPLIEEPLLGPSGPPTGQDMIGHERDAAQASGNLVTSIDQRVPPVADVAPHILPSSRGTHTYVFTDLYTNSSREVQRSDEDMLSAGGSASEPGTAIPSSASNPSMGSFETYRPPHGWFTPELQANGRMRASYSANDGSSVVMVANIEEMSNRPNLESTHKTTKIEYQGTITKNVPGFGNVLHQFSATGLFDASSRIMMEFKMTISAPSHLSSFVFGSRESLELLRSRQ